MTHLALTNASAAFHPRLLNRIEQVTESGCWIWMGNLNAYGYGRLEHAGRHMAAHRVMFEQYRKPIPAGLQIDHLCRVRCCVNPWHLEPVTDIENLRRGFGVPARNARKTHCPRCGGNYSPRPDGTGRYCRPCANTRTLNNHRRRQKEVA